MGSKGSQTVQQNTNQQQTYSPNPQAYGAISGALGQAQNVAQTPFSTPQAPVAGFSPQQQQAFDITGQAAGYAQPFINQAQQYFSPQGTQQFLNPYTANVSANLKDIFGQQNSQNNGQLTQAAGGVGADRIAVGQSELAKQQGLAAGQTFAGLYNNAAQQAQTAGFGTANLGTAGQNAQLQGAQALLGTGGLQQQLQQAQLNSPYQQQLQQIAWPYQNAQFLSGITGALTPGLGGTTTGFGGNGTTYPGASPWGTIAGLGLTGLGVYGAGQKAGWWGGGGGNTPSDTSGGGGLDGSARGGRINPYYAGGGATDDGGDGVPSMASGSDPTLRMLEANQLEANGRSAPGGGPIQLPPGFDSRSADMSPQSLVPDGKIAGIQPHIPQLNMAQAPQQQSAGGGKGAGMGDVASAAMKILPMVLALKRGGRVDESEQELNDAGLKRMWNYRRDQLQYRDPSQFPPPPINPGQHVTDPQGMNRDVRQLARGGPTNPYAFADGGTPVEHIADMFGGAPQGPVDPAQYNRLQDYGASRPDYYGTGAVEPHMAEIPLPRSRPDDAPTDVAGGDELPDEATPAAGVTSPYRGLAGPAPERRNHDHGFVDSPWAALLSAGLGTLAAAGTRDAHGLPTPALAAIGQGGQQGLKTLEGQRASAQKQQSIEQEAQKLDQAARQHLDEFTKMKPYQAEQVNLHRRAAELTAIQPVKIGTDRYGREIYGIRDPKSGVIHPIDPATGMRPTDAASPGSQPSQATSAFANPQTGERVEGAKKVDVPTAPVKTAFGDQEDAALPLRSILTAGEAPEGVHPEVLDEPGLTPGQRAKIKQIGEGRAAFLPLGRGNVVNQMIMDKAYEYNPNLDQTTFARRQRAENYFSVGTAGGGGQNVVALNRFAAHSGSLLALAEKLQQGGYQDWNAARNAINRHGFGWVIGDDPKMKDILGQWDVNAKGVGDEAAKVFAGSNTALADRETWEKVLKPDTPFTVMKAKLKQAAEMAEQALAANVASYNEGTRTNHKPREFMTPRSVQIFDALKQGVPISSVIESGGQQGGGQDPMSQARAAIAAKPDKRDAIIQRLREHGIDPAGL